MRKYIYILLLSIFVFLSPNFVKADVTYNFTSGNFHVVYILGGSTSCDNKSIVEYTSSNLEHIKSFDTYEEAYNYLNSLNDVVGKDLAIVGKRLDTTGNYVNKILYSRYALVDLNTAGTSALTSNVYTTATGSTAYTYINGYGSFGGVDGAFINYNTTKARAQIKISGAVGWINSLLSSNTYNGYDIVPTTAVKSPSYYYVNSSGVLVHRLAKKITASNCYSGSLSLGPAPSYLTSKDNDGNTIKYYSYDGNYFYTTLQGMLKDYSNGTHTNAVNSIPYYNYYLYSSVRTPSNLTTADIQGYLDSRSITSSSALYGTASTFTDAESKYGVNAGIALATAINESAWGRSSLALNKNNLFGHNAYDSSVMTSASAYNTVADCIYRHAYYYINSLFVETKDTMGRYFGGHLGNKGSGINVKYASDAYWGEKIAAIYYSIDAYAESKGYYSSLIGIKTTDVAAPVMSEASTSSTTLYKLKSASVNVSNIPVVILGKVNGENINGSDIWYKIQTDAILNDARTGVIQDTDINTYYDKTKNYAYIHSSYITLMDSSVDNVYIQKEGILGLDSLKSNADGTISITGYLIISGIDNSKSKTISYDLIFTDQNGNTYEKALNRITDTSSMPYTIPNIDGNDYTYSWFNGNINLGDLPSGDYSIKVRARSGMYESTEVLNNKLSADIASKFNVGDRGYQFKTNYYLKTVPVELFVRDNGLISNKTTPTTDNMINQYQSLSLSDGKLNISGISFNVGGDYSTSANVQRKIIFENISTYERFEYDLGYTDNGSYNVTLVVPDGYSKTRAWYNSSIDLSNITKGTYAVYIKTTTSNVEDAAELIDVFEREITSTTQVSDKTYSMSVNKNQRYRLELSVK